MLLLLPTTIFDWCVSEISVVVIRNSSCTVRRITIREFSWNILCPQVDIPQFLIHVEERLVVELARANVSYESKIQIFKNR